MGCVLISAGIQVPDVQAQELPFTHYTTDSDRNPLPSAAVNKVYQDRLGYIWMAVFSSGLVRYDGTRMEVYNVEDGLRDLEVWGLLEDRSGRLWVASNGGLAVSEEPLAGYEHGRRIRFAAELNEVPLLNQRVWTHSIAVGRDGSVWAGTSRDGVIRYRFDSSGSAAVDTFRTSPHAGTENTAVLAVVARSDSSVWIAVENGGLQVFETGGNTFKESAAHNDIGGENVNILREDDSGGLWAGTREGRVLQLTGLPGEIVVQPLGPRLGAAIVSIVVSDDGTLWAGTEGDGVLQANLSDGSSRVIGRENGLISENVRHVMVDVEGNTWFAHSGGVSKLRVDYPAFANYSPRSHAGEPPVLPAPGVGSVISSDEAGDPCSIWAATSEGGVACISADGTSTYLLEADGLRSNWVNAVLRDRKGRIWMGTVRGINGLSHNATSLPVFGAERVVTFGGQRGRLRGYTNLTILSISSTDIPIDASPRSTTEAIWFPGIRHLIGLIDDQWYVLSTAAGLPASILNTVAMDDSGRLWVGTRDRGLYRTTKPMSVADLRKLAYEDVTLDGERFGRQITTPLFEQVWSVENGAPSNNIGPLLWNDGRMWVGTPQGLAVLDGESAMLSTLLTQGDGLGANNVTSMSLSPVSGSLWVGTNQGLGEINPNTREVMRSVTQEDGLIDNEVWLYGSVHAGSDGAIYFGTAKGVSIYRPDLDAINPVEPRIRLRSALFSPSGESHNEVVFEYAALSFVNEKAVRYKTRLSGYDRDWSPEKSDPKIRYTSLPAFLTSRTYTLEVLARNNDGIWSAQPIAYSFEVPAPWWLRWWAIAAYLMVLCVTVLAFVRRQRIQVIKKEQEKVRAREMELTAEAALARSEAAEAQARALEAENNRKALELEKAQELQHAYHELQQAHVHLKRTQAQLVQQEKLASLGQLTAGIAHEIKNPLNFINNFAQLTDELAAELAVAMAAGADKNEIEAIILDLGMNAKKIQEHGQRADGIVRGMLEHARVGDGKRELVHLNRLVDEYVSLAYHGMRSQLSDVSIDITRDYADDDVEVEVATQDIGRVLINLLTNALYAVQERALHSNGAYRPRVIVKTEHVDDSVEIHIADNGSGVPAHVRNKIFEPFFTTKPTGSGTGLGLSLAYDIITQGHAGSLTLSRTDGEGATFIIKLPLSVTAAKVA
jgi:signal transduction histidine kinase/ligand-binding sensor domain-containing protein